MQPVALFLFIAPLLVLAGPLYPVCSMYSTLDQYFLTGPCTFALSLGACASAGGEIASIYEHTKDAAAMQEYLNIRRGMRACNDTVRAWVNDKALETKAVDEGATTFPPPMRILTIRGMIDGDGSDLTKEYMVLCRTTL